MSRSMALFGLPLETPFAGHFRLLRARGARGQPTCSPRAPRRRLWADVRSVAMAKRNLTVQLDEDVIHRAKVAAAKRGTSVSGLVTQELERLVEADARYEEAQRRAEQAMGRTQRRGGRRRGPREVPERGTLPRPSW